MSSLNTIQTIINNLNEEIAYFEELINNAPKGNLVCRETSSGRYRYAVDVVSEKVIPGENMHDEDIHDDVSKEAISEDDISE